MRKVNSEILEKIRFLRSKGYSVPEISKEVPVSKTTVLRYVRGVEILPEYLSEWAGKRGGSRRIKLHKDAKALEEAKKFVNKLSDREKMLFVCALYWAEGTKSDFSLSNTDPDLVKVFVECMRSVFKLEDNKFFINVRLYEDLDREKSLEFWSKVVRIPKENLKGVNILQGKKKGKLEYGMCRVRIAKGSSLLRQIMSVNKAIFESLSL